MLDKEKTMIKGLEQRAKLGGAFGGAVLMDETVNAPSFVISVDNQSLLSSSAVSLSDVEVTQELNMPAMFRFVITPRGTEDDFWNYFELTQFRLGSQVKIKLGQHSFSNVLIQGEVTAVEPVVTKQLMSLEVRGFDKMHRLRLGTKSRVFNDLTDSELVAVIGRDLGLVTVTEPTTVKYSHLFQNNVNDFDFLKSRIERIRYELAMENDSLVLKKPGEKEEPVASYRIRYNMDTFRVSLNYVSDGEMSRFSGWDVKKKKAIEGKAGPGDETSRMKSYQFATNMTRDAFGSAESSVTSEALLDKQEAEMLAKARLNRSLSYGVTGKGEVDGNPVLVPGRNIEVTGLGRFSGLYYLTKTQHLYTSEQGYKTKFEVRRVGV